MRKKRGRGSGPPFQKPGEAQIRGPWSWRLFHYLRRPVQIPNIPAVILTIAALASASHCQSPQRARRRHCPKPLFCSCTLPEQEGGAAQARDLWRRREAAHRTLPPPTGNVLGGNWPFTPEPGGLMAHENPQPRSATPWYFVLLEKKMHDYGIKECSLLWREPCATELLSPVGGHLPNCLRTVCGVRRTPGRHEYLVRRTPVCWEYAMSKYGRLAWSGHKSEKSPLLPFFVFLVIKSLCLELETTLKTFP